MKDVYDLLSLGITISGIIIVCLIIGNKLNNLLLWIIIGIVISLLYLFKFMVKK